MDTRNAWTCLNVHIMHAVVHIACCTCILHAANTHTHNSLQELGNLDEKKRNLLNALEKSLTIRSPSE